MKRVNYVSGILLKAEDFNADQQYHRDKQKMHNRFLHGYGVVWGLEVAMRKGVIYVSPGLGLACTGDEIVVNEPVAVPLPRMRGSTYLTIRFIERGSEPVPAAAKDGLINSRIEELYEIAFEAHDPCHGHTRSKSSRMACGQSHSLPIARLVRGKEGWRIDSQFHAPRVTSHIH